MIVQNNSSDLICNNDMVDEIKNLSFKLNNKAPIVALEQTILAREMLLRYVNLHTLALSLSFSIKNILYN